MQVTFDDGMITIKGERKQQKEDKNEKYHRIESFYGSFQRAFALPENINRDVEAELKWSPEVDETDCHRTCISVRQRRRLTYADRDAWRPHKPTCETAAAAVAVASTEGSPPRLRPPGCGTVLICALQESWLHPASCDRAFLVRCPSFRVPP